MENKISIDNIHIFNKGGLPVTIEGRELTPEETLKTGFIAAISMTIEALFEDELSHLKAQEKSLIVKRKGDYFGCVMVDELSDFCSVERIGTFLDMILDHVNSEMEYLDVCRAEPVCLDSFSSLEFGSIM